MQLYELEKRLTMDVKYLAKQHDIDMTNVYVNVQTSKGAFGHYAPGRWLVGESKDKKDELALNPEYFTNFLEVLDTMLHELVHVYCKQHGIKDTSRGGYYHNQRFKQCAEKFGLKCVPAQSGWNTSPNGNEEVLEAINSTLPYPITCDMVRRSDGKKIGNTRERKPSHTYCCPSCNTTVKSKDLVFLACYGCKTIMAIDSDDEKAEEWLSKLKELTQIVD